MSEQKIIVEIPNYEAGELGGLNVHYEDGVPIEHVIDLYEVSLAELVPKSELIPGLRVESAPRLLRMLLICDPRIGPPREEPLRRATLPFCPEERDGICGWWFTFSEYEVRGGELYPRRNTRWEWP